MKNAFYHQWRKRKRRYQRGLNMVNMASLALLTIFVLSGLWWDTHCTGYFCSSEYGKLRFMETCERVATWVDDYRKEKGHLPDTLNTGWLYLNREDYPWLCYYDTTMWDRMVFEYRHWGDSAYIIELLEWVEGRFISAPEFEGYLFYRWDWAQDTLVGVDTVYRCH